MGSITNVLRVLGLTILVVAAPIVRGDSEVPPGSAGNHASVQSGQFLTTNDENYGLRVVPHTPYVAPPDNELDEGKEGSLQTAQLRGVVPKDKGAEYGGDQQQQQQQQLCAGCHNRRNRPNAVAVPVAQYLRQIGPASNTGYSYSVNYEGDGTSNGWNWDLSGGQQNQQWAGQPQRQWNLPQQDQQWSPRPQGQWATATATVRQGPWRSSPPPQTMKWATAPQQQWTPNGQQRAAAAGVSRQQQQQQQQQQQWSGVLQQQHLQLNNDGGYSFSYSAPQSSRQEQRSMNGVVSGSYAYSDPTGQQVKVDYRSTPDEGFQAFGPSIPHQSPSQLLPIPVQDTPEVVAERQRFFQAYNEQLRLIQEAHAQARAQAQAQASNQDKIVSIHSENEKREMGEGQQSQDEMDDDAVVITRAEDDEEPPSIPAAVELPPINVHNQEHQGQSGAVDASYKYSIFLGEPNQNNWQQSHQQQQQVWDQQPQPYGVVPGYQDQRQRGGQPSAIAVPLSPSYQYTQVLGQGQSQGQRQYVPLISPHMQTMGAATNQQDNVASPAYFYYVSVGGGSPSNYITSPTLFQSKLSTSAKAVSAGAIPQDAVHDSQVQQPSHERTQTHRQQSGANVPVYLDVSPEQFQAYFASSQGEGEGGKNIIGFIPLIPKSVVKDGTLFISSSSGDGSSKTSEVEGGTDGVKIQPGNRIPVLILKTEK